MSSDSDDNTDLEGAEKRKLLPVGRTSSKTIIIAVVVALAVFAIDSSLPLGIAGGVPYVALILMGIWFSRPQHIYVLAVVGSALTIIGYFTSPSGGIFWVVLTNRGLALFAIWITAFLIASRKVFENELCLARDNLGVEAAEREKELRENQARLSVAPTVLYDVSVSGQDLKLTWLSDNVTNILGYSVDECLEDPQWWFGNLHPDHQKASVTNGSDLLSHKHYLHEYWFRHKDGNYRWMRDEMQILHDGDGEPYRIIGSWSDTTERKSLTEELLKAKTEAEAANLAKTKFLAAASHDLRQPLQAAHLFLDVLANKEHQPENREIISHLGASVGALDHLLNSLLDISRLEAGLIEPSVQAVSITPMMKRLVEEYSYIARDEGVEIKSVMTKVAVYTDPGLLESILRNLLSNAVKHAERGKVLLGCRQHGDSITVEVWDNGSGIPEDRLNDIFGEFVQIGNEGRDRSKGLGLGLSIVKKLAGLLDHRIDVRSWEGNGSAFTIELPLAREEAVSDQLKKAPAAKPLTKASVFIVDDEPAIRTSLSLVLKQKGYEVHAASGHDCQECKKITSEMTAPPDIILADFRLQNGNTGIDAIKCLRETFKENIPAILLTGDTAPDRLAEAKSSGFSILHKPINADDLLQALADAIKAE